MSNERSKLFFLLASTVSCLVCAGSLQANELKVSGFTRLVHLDDEETCGRLNDYLQDLDEGDSPQFLCGLQEVDDPEEARVVAVSPVTIGEPEELERGEVDSPPSVLEGEESEGEAEHPSTLARTFLKRVFPRASQEIDRWDGKIDVSGSFSRGSKGEKSQFGGRILLIRAVGDEGRLIKLDSGADYWSEGQGESYLEANGLIRYEQPVSDRLRWVAQGEALRDDQRNIDFQGLALSGPVYTLIPERLEAEALFGYRRKQGNGLMEDSANGTYSFRYGRPIGNREGARFTAEASASHSIWSSVNDELPSDWSFRVLTRAEMNLINELSVFMELEVVHDLEPLGDANETRVNGRIGLSHRL